MPSAETAQVQAGASVVAGETSVAASPKPFHALDPAVLKDLETPFEQTVFTTPDLYGGEAMWVAWELGYRRGPFTFPRGSPMAVVAEQRDP